MAIIWATSTGTAPTVLVWYDAGTTTATTSSWYSPTASYSDSHAYAPSHTALTRPNIIRRARSPLDDDMVHMAAAQNAAYEDRQRCWLAEQQRQQAAAYEARLAREQQARAAHGRARDLLLQHLTPAQRETFEHNNWFVVEGGLSKQRYRIHNVNHVAANIDVLSAGDGKEIVVHRLCGHCDVSAVPLFDQLLAQKLMLQFDEERFLKLANKHLAQRAA